MALKVSKRIRFIFEALNPGKPTTQIGEIAFCSNLLKAIERAKEPKVRLLMWFFCK